MHNLKIFISYCHEDEKVKDALKKHLAPLRREGAVIWDDRSLSAGTENIDDEILQQIDSSSIFIALLSAAYIDSYYCVDVELSEAVEKVLKKGGKIVPIVVSPCEADSLYTSRFMTLPQDRRSLSSFDDINEPLHYCFQKINDLAQQETSLPVESSVLRDKKSSEISESFSSFLKSTEIDLQHRGADELTLEDIYVWPDLIWRGEQKSDDDLIDNSKLIVEKVKKGDTSNIAIFGGEQSGKTAFLKRIFDLAVSAERVPVYVDCEFSRLGLDRLELEYKSQYSDAPDWADIDKSKVLCLLDNFDSQRNKLSDKRKFMSASAEKGVSVLACLELTSIYEDHIRNLLGTYDLYEMAEFGYRLRDKLIEKWNACGDENFETENERLKHKDIQSSNIDALIAKNVVPKKPIYILTILQTLENVRSNDLQMTSYGSCYQTLINQKLGKLKIKPMELPGYENYLTHLAFFILKTSRGLSISGSEYAIFHAAYAEKYNVASKEKVVGILSRSKIVDAFGDSIKFGYRYFFYFYAAKYIADYLKDDDISQQVSSLCNSLHSQRSANILVFLCHHSRDPNVLDEILVHTAVIFDGIPKADLNKENENLMFSVMDSIPKLVMESKDVESAREERLKSLDEKDRLTSIAEDDEEADDEELEFEDTESEKNLSDINRSYRALELLGQILRNRFGDLPKPRLEELAREASGSGLRFLSFWMHLVEESQSELESIIEEVIKDNSKKSAEEVDVAARKFFASFVLNASFGILWKISSACGSDNLTPLFSKLAKSEPESNALMLISICMKLEYEKQIPFKDIEAIRKKAKGNLFVERLLHLMLVRYNHFHHVTYKDKQRIKGYLSIPVEKQVAVSMRKRQMERRK